MSKPVLSDLDFGSSTRGINVPNPVSSGDMANKGYVDARFEKWAFKDDVRAASTANINLASPGATIDGVTMDANDRFLAKDQTDPSENGIYIFNGDATPATRAADADAADEFLSAIVSVNEGTVNAGTTWMQTEVDITLDTDDILWQSAFSSTPDASETVKGKIEIADQTETDAGSDDTKAITPEKLANYAGLVKVHAANVGDNSATQFDITHNFNTRDVIVTVYKNSSNYDVVLCDVKHHDANTTRLNFAAAPGTNAYRVVIMGLGNS